MSETRKTLTFGGIAVILVVIALATSPRRATPAAFLDRGEQFFPDFTNPNDAASLEVVEYNEQTAEATAFKVINENGKWSIPSQNGYPADGKERLAKTAAGVIGITKADFRSDNVADYEPCGVIDPLDETSAALKGRGKRVTMRGGEGQVLADFIIGKSLPDRSDYHFVRIPDQKRIYVAKMDFDISTKFKDWIEKDLLEVDRYAIDEVVLEDYSIDERTLRVNTRDTITLEKKDGVWKARKMAAGQEVDSAKMNDLLSALDGLTIVGVRPKPKGLSASMQRSEGGLQISQADMLSLQGKGYYFTRDGSLMSNEGELRARTTDGITYTLRFGEIVSGQGDTSATDSDASGGSGENRYLFITAAFDPKLFPEPPAPSNTDFKGKSDDELTDEDRHNKDLEAKHEEWKKKAEKGRKLAEKLNARFADWYYVISSDSFDKVHLTRKDLMKKTSSTS